MEKENVIYATGKRKRSVARTWLTPGNGEIVVNNRPLDEYFQVLTARITAQEPLVLTGTVDSYDIKVKVLNRLYVSYSENVKESHIKITRGNGVNLRVKYEVRTPIMGNLDVIARFDKSVRLAN